MRREEVAYRNRRLDVKTRVADLLARMTLAEKVAQMLCVWGRKKETLFDSDGRLSSGKLASSLKDGIGQIGRLSDTNGGLGPVEMAELANKIQKFFLEETRLGIPVIFHEECLHGLAAPEATSYPQPIGLASTFNPALVEEVYSAVARDARSRGAHQALTPVLDIAREPRWGRVEETFGEDPYLVSQMGLAAVRGFQGDGSFGDGDRVIATLKHFAAHGQPESGSNCGPANVSERLLRDTFLHPFKEAVRKGKVASVMASYNEVDGVPSHANDWLLRDVLRDEWGFGGYVVSDYYAITELNEKPDTQSHRVAADKKEAALLAAKAGVNIELPDIDCYPNLAGLVNEGRMNEEEIDALVAPMLEYKFRLGLFDNPYVDPASIRNDAKLEEDRRVAMRVALETITLLKNEGNLLPIDIDGIGTIAVIGPNANRVLLGGYSGIPKFYTTVLDGIEERVGDKARILYNVGCRITVGGSWNEDKVVLPDRDEDRRLIDEAVESARNADLVILALGDNEQTSREAWSTTHLGDRPDLDLVGTQNELVREVLKTGKPTVALLLNGRPSSMNYVNAHVPAIVECWYLGQETGGAIASVLFGDYNPSGKLPISIPRSAGHLPCYYNYKPSARRGYLFDDITPLYPFGYGMSYTKFSFCNLRLEKSSIALDETTRALVDIRNIGDRAGEEVVQMYVRDVISSVTRPVKELKGFVKISLLPGESATVSLTISPEQLCFTNINMLNVVEPGEFEIMVGNSSRDEDLTKVVLRVT